MANKGKILDFADLHRQAYHPVWTLQHQLQQQRIQQEINDTLLLVEHHPVYTIGKNGSDLHVIADNNFLNSREIEIVHVDRGGDVTYHGPGQLVGYPIFDLRQHQKSISWYVRQLESVFIEALKHWEIEGRREEGLTGIWVGQEKILAIGVRISRWVTMHGFAFNVNTTLTDFQGIIPCGIFHKGVTSLQEVLGKPVDMNVVKNVVLQAFQTKFDFSGMCPVNMELPSGDERSLSAG